MTVVNNKKIAKNTLFLYIRMIILMVVNLYTSRVVLESLGVDDYGVYNVVGGFVSMFGIVSNALSSAISRYLTYTLGENNSAKLKEIFSTSIIIQLALSLLIVLLIETVGVWFLNFKMNIPSGSLTAANWVLQFSVVTFIFNLLNIPYNAVIIAHERMKAFAYIGLLEGFLNLLVAFIILWSTSDKLVLYAGLMCLISVGIRMVYTIYCKKNFEECNHKLKCNKKLIKEMFGFAGWNFYGSTAGLLRSQGLNILFNLYGGPVVNAARGLSVQVETAVIKFSNSFYTAVQPQITKSFANNETKPACELACRSSRFAFYLLSMLCLPIIFNADFILKIWLKNVPQYTTSFVVVILLYGLIESFSQTPIQLMLASGKIKKYQLVVGTIVIMSFFAGWGLLKLGFSPIIAQASIIIFSIIALIVRAEMLHSMIGFPNKYYYINVVLRCLTLFSIVAIISFYISKVINPGWIGLFESVIAIEFISCIIFTSLGLQRNERDFLLNKLKSKFIK
ncbi:MAG: MATE family efflux transporter [Clostridiales bacterium]|nr:MATE family efflux transporter [Clostridiales bacterium]